MSRSGCPNPQFIFTNPFAIKWTRKWRRFRWKKTEWGFDQLISLNVFNDASSGYLVDDCCIFGAEIFVIERAGKGECMSIVKEVVNNTYTWTLENFSAWNSEYYTSQVFVIDGHKWTLRLYSNGYSTEKGKSLSNYLHFEDPGTLNSGQKLLTVFILRARDQLFGEHREQKVLTNSILLPTIGVFQFLYVSVISWMNQRDSRLIIK